MGLLDRFFGPPSQDKFAKLVISRLSRAGVSGPFEYDQAKFAITQGRGALIVLHNAYAEYCRAAKGDRDNVMQTFLRSWATTFEIPDEFDDAKPDLLPVLRARTYFEVDLKRIAPDADLDNYPYQIVGEDLCLSLVYDLPTTMMGVTQENLDAWGVTLYEGLEAAKENLKERTTSYAQIGRLISVMHGDNYDASRLVLADSIAASITDEEFQGPVIAMVPNRDTLLLASADDDESLETMVKIAEDALQHERRISGGALRLVDGEWEPWLPAAEHPLRQSFAKLRMQTVGSDYASQQEVLQAELQQESRELFVASFSAIQRDDSGEVLSYSVWSAGISSLLPRTDYLFLAGPNEQGEVVKLASGPWEQVERIAGRLMKPQDCYPPRYLVEEFPSADELQQIGIAE